MAINRLIDSFKNFREEYYDRQPEVYRSLVELGQSPDVMIIACSDSRVNPSIIAKAKPGELFVLRNVANLVPPYQADNNYHGTGAAIEFAVCDLGVDDIIVLGHSHCGGIRCLCDGVGEADSREFIEDWMSIVSHAVKPGLEGEELYRYVEKEAVRISMNNLLSFPWVKKRAGSGDLRIHGWWFDLEAGDLMSCEKTGAWTSLIK